MMQESILWTISIFIVPLFLSIILHEIAHGWVAYKCGDTTAKRQNRLSFNVISHIDPVGSVLVPGLLLLSHSGVMFGWAKPVPVNFNALNDKKRDMGLVALAGPALNFFLALLSGVCLVTFQKSITHPDNLFQLWLLNSMQAMLSINISLCAFNLFPILPLDGGRIIASILPNKLSQQYGRTEPYGMMILLCLLFILPALNIDILHNYMIWMGQGLFNSISFILKGIL